MFFNGEEVLITDEFRVTLNVPVGLAQWYCVCLTGEQSGFDCPVQATRSGSGNYCAQVTKREWMMMNPPWLSNPCAAESTEVCKQRVQVAPQNAPWSNKIFKNLIEISTL